MIPIAGGYKWFKLGTEIKIGSDFRFAPFGNRKGHRFGELPHYHRRILTRLVKPLLVVELAGIDLGKRAGDADD